MSQRTNNDNIDPEGQMLIFKDNCKKASAKRTMISKREEFSRIESSPRLAWKSQKSKEYDIEKANYEIESHNKDLSNEIDNEKEGGGGVVLDSWTKRLRWFQIYFVVQVVVNVIFIAYYLKFVFKTRLPCIHEFTK